jgi:hypothetical protein
MNTDFRALCAELLKALSEWALGQGSNVDAPLITRTRTALAQPEPEGVGDEEWDAIKDRLWRHYETTGYQGERFIYQGDFDTALDVARQELTRYARPAIEPVPVAERLPEPEDCDESGLTCNGGGWCWWFEQSSQMWVADFYSSHYTHWLPHHALPVPTP